METIPWKQFPGNNFLETIPWKEFPGNKFSGNNAIERILWKQFQGKNSRERIPGKELHDYYSNSLWHSGRTSLLFELQNDWSHSANVFGVPGSFWIKVAEFSNSFPFCTRCQLKYEFMIESYVYQVYFLVLCCKKRQNSSNQETGLENRGPLNCLNDTKLILNDYGGHTCSFRTNLVSFKNMAPTLGGVKSLVSRYIEGCSFWGIWDNRQGRVRTASILVRAF